MTNSGAFPRSNEVVRALLISPLPENHAALGHIFERSKWILHNIDTCDAALAYLGQNPDTVVICERNLHQGDWRFVLQNLDILPVRPNLIVTTRLADDDLWAEVLNVGGYDVLAQPFEPQEVYRIVFQAWHEQKRRAHPLRRANPPR